MSELKLLASASDLTDTNDRIELFEDVPEWGVRIRFLTPTLRRLLAYEAARRGLKPEDPRDQAEEVVLAISACAVDADGEPLFSSPEQMEWLRSRSPNVLVRLNSVCTRVCGASREGVEQASGESEGTPGSD